VSRSATFVFILGERYFGTITIHVGERDAGRYNFTSALAVRMLRVLGPQVAAMTIPGDPKEPLRCRDVQMPMSSPTPAPAPAQVSQPPADGQAAG
jgi:hypothetical protein